MKNYRALFKYYKDVTLYNLSFAAVVAMLFSVTWSILLFGTVGSLIGFIGFQTFQKQEYTMYFNLGLSKRSLYKWVLLINFSILVIPLIIYLIATINRT